MRFFLYEAGRHGLRKGVGIGPSCLTPRPGEGRRECPTPPSPPQVPSPTCRPKDRVSDVRKGHLHYSTPEVPRHSSDGGVLSGVDRFF